jgi:hypothetical protein
MPARKSAFVTGLAWSFIVPGVLLYGVALIQLIGAFVAAPATDELLRGNDALALPPALVFMLSHAVAITSAVLVFAAVTIAAGVGLLKRTRWGWLATIALLVLSIALNFAGLVVHLPIEATALPGLGELPPELGLDLPGLIASVERAVKLLVLVFTAVCVWFVYRLCTPAVRAEFDA